MQHITKNSELPLSSNPGIYNTHMYINCIFPDIQHRFL